MTQRITIYFCTKCDMRDYPIGKVKKLGKCKCGKDTRYELLVEV